MRVGGGGGVGAGMSTLSYFHRCGCGMGVGVGVGVSWGVGGGYKGVCLFPLHSSSTAARICLQMIARKHLGKGKIRTSRVTVHLVKIV